MGPGLRALIALLAAGLWASLPWLLSVRTGFPHRDAAFTRVSMWHAQNVVLRGADWRDAPLAWPLPHGTTAADWTPAQAVVDLPLRLAGIADRYEIVAFLGLLLTAVAAERIARALCGPGVHTWVAGVACGFGALPLVHARHVNLTWHGVVLAAAALAWRPGAGAAFAAGALAAGAFHFGFYLGLHAVVVTGIVAAASVRSWRSAAAMAAGAALVGLTVLPVAALYQAAMHAQDVALPLRIQQDESADLLSWVLPNAAVPWQAGLPSIGRPGGDSANAGWFVTALAAVGAAAVARDRGRHPAWWVIGAIGVVGALLAIGPEPRIGGWSAGVPGPYRLALWLPGIEALRAPVRWAFLTHGALALFAAAGVARLGRVHPALPVAALAAVLVELPRADVGEAVRPREVAERLAEEPGPGAVFVLHRRGDRAASARALLSVTVHGRPLVSGSLARESAELAEVARVANTWPSPEADALFARIGVGFVVLDGVPAQVGCDPVGPDWLCRR